jgi:ankyrin repeat protein
LIAKHPRVWQIKNKIGETAMQSAIQNGNLESLQHFILVNIEENVDITKTRDEHGNSLLATAIIHNQYEIVKYLLEIFPNLIHVKNNYGSYPIHLSAINGNQCFSSVSSRSDRGEKIIHIFCHLFQATCQLSDLCVIFRKNILT